VLARDESIEFLRQRTGAGDLAALDTLAELVGDLPLALVKAAAYLEETRESLESCAELVRDHRTMRGRHPVPLVFRLMPAQQPDCRLSHPHTTHL
jgi:hypothetical protein